MEQMAITDRQDYEEYRKELKRKLDETSENFIIIGYILKQVRDRQLYRNGGYGDINAFGFGEYGLSKSTVSRFMNINTKFSVGGNSREIRPEYRGYGSSKLQEMLSINEEDMALVTADTTVDQVQELKKAVGIQKQTEREEHENSLPLLRIAAGETGDGTQEPEPADPFRELLTKFWLENEELYRKVAAGLATPEIVAGEISPSGSMTYRNGVNIVFFYDHDRGLKLRSYEKGKAEITPYTYGELVEITRGLDPIQSDAGRERMPEPVENAGPVEKEPVATPQSGAGEETVPYAPIPGQASVEDLTGIMPDRGEDATFSAENHHDAVSVDNGDVIDGEYRELDAGAARTGTGKTGGKNPYTDTEVRNAISYFDIEYIRMTGLHQDTPKHRHYKIALECIRKCHGGIAKQMDMEACMGKEGSRA